MRVSNLVVFALSSISVAFAQTAADVLGLVTRLNTELQSSAPGDITPKLTALTTQIKSLGTSLSIDPSTRSLIAVQGASIMSRVANQGMTVGPGALGGDIQLALKGFLVEIGLCVPDVDKEISRMLVDVSVPVFLKNNFGGAMAVLSQADSKTPVVDVNMDGQLLAVDVNVGGGSVSVL
ncbi:hypothetical protein V565_223600 [Rhizoctonia solani 123E]|uniref:Transmembrane protein n=1 Tax=Rhizoctonia solani 123E TaxID=1423351 RepID=A0A074RFU9_9AGAM|nr:hypothetical protein V565_223600 [Rhizoctonia solani 123E]